MPVPEGIISTSIGPSEPQSAEQIDAILDAAIAAADAEEAENDLPELS